MVGNVGACDATHRSTHRSHVLSSLRRYYAVYYGSRGFRESGHPASPFLLPPSARVATCRLCHFKRTKCERARGNSRAESFLNSGSYFEWRYLLQVEGKFPTSLFRSRQATRRQTFNRRSCARSRVNICICNLSPMSFMRLTQVLISQETCRGSTRQRVCSFKSKSYEARIPLRFNDLI